MRSVFWAAPLLALALAAGCKDTTDVTTASSSELDLELGLLDAKRIEVVLVGRVMAEDVSEFRDTGQLHGLSGAEVSLVITPSDVRAVLTNADGSGNVNHEGTFEISGIFPHESRVHKLRVSAPGYEGKDFLVFIPAEARESTGRNPRHIIDLGRLIISQATNFKVFVTEEGAPKRGIRVISMDLGGGTGANTSFVSDRFRMDPSDFNALQEYVAATYILNGATVPTSLSGLVSAITGSGLSPFGLDYTTTEYVATTDSTGIAEFSSLSVNREYVFTVVADDEDNDGLFDWRSETTTRVNPGFEPQPLAIELDDPGSPTRGPKTVGDTRLDVSFGSSFTVNTFSLADTTTITASTVQGEEGQTISSYLSVGSMTVVFEFPVVVVQGDPNAATPDRRAPRVTFLNNLVDHKTSGFQSVTRTVVPATATQSENGFGNVWTFSWDTTQVPALETAQLEFSARDPNTSAVNSGDSGFFELPFTKPATTLSSTSVTLDNYNGTTASTTAAASEVFLEFPEPVRGFYQVIKITNQISSTQTSIITPNDPTRNQIEGGEILFHDGVVNTARVNPALTSGTVPSTATNGKYFVVGMNDGGGSDLNLGDNSSTLSRRVQFYISVESLDGARRLEGNFDLVVD